MARFITMSCYDVQSCQSEQAICSACKTPLYLKPKKVFNNRQQSIDFCTHCGVIFEQATSYFKTIYALKQFVNTASITTPLDIVKELNWHLRVDLKLTHDNEINDKYDHIDMEHGDREKYKTLVKNNTIYFKHYIEEYSVPYYIGVEIFKWLDNPIDFLNCLQRNRTKMQQHNDTHRVFSKDYSDDMMWTLPMIDNLLIHYPEVVNLLNPYLFPDYIKYINPNLPYFHEFANPNILKVSAYKGNLIKNRVSEAIDKMDIMHANKCLQSEKAIPILKKFNVLNNVESIILNKKTNNAFNYYLTKEIPMGTNVHLHLLGYDEFKGQTISTKLIKHNLFEFNKFVSNSTYAQYKYIHNTEYKETCRFDKEIPLF